VFHSKKNWYENLISWYNTSSDSGFPTSMFSQVVGGIHLSEQAAELCGFFFIYI